MMKLFRLEKIMRGYMKSAITPNENSICLRVSSVQCLLRGAQELSGRNGNLNHINEKTHNNRKL